MAKLLGLGIKISRRPSKPMLIHMQRWPVRHVAGHIQRVGQAGRRRQRWIPTKTKAIAPQQGQLSHRGDISTGFRVNHLTTAIIRMNMNAYVCLIELAQKRGKINFSLPGIEQGGDVMELHDDNPKPTHERFGGRIKVSVFSTFNVDLKQQVLGDVRCIEVDPLLQTDAILASIDVQPFFVKDLEARDQGRGQLINITAEITHVTMNAMLPCHLIFKRFSIVHARRKTSLDSIDVIGHEVSPISITAHANKRHRRGLRRQDRQKIRDVAHPGLN